MNNISNQLIAIIIAIQSICTVPALAEGDKAVDTSKVARVDFNRQNAVNDSDSLVPYWREGLVLLLTVVAGYVVYNNKRTSSKAERVQLETDITTFRGAIPNPNRGAIAPGAIKFYANSHWVNNE